jgi:hypothetical protein
LSICDNLEPDSNVIEESDSQKEKHCSLKNTTLTGILTNLRFVFSNAFVSIRSRFDIFSITIDSIDLGLGKISEEINLIDEGSHSFLTSKSEWPIVETQRMKPSATIIRGQNSSAISQITWEICDCDCDWSCECEFVMKMANVNGRRRSGNDIQKA